MYAIYSLLLSLAAMFYFPFYFFKLKLRRGENLHLKQRLGWGLKSGSAQGKVIWIHAVSVGEVLAVQNLVREIKQRYPDWRVCFSTLTETGFRIARQKLGDEIRLFYVPLDFRCIVKKFFKMIKPDLFVLAESEFWPHLLREAGRSAGSVMVINGRISPRSLRRMARYRRIAGKILAPVDTFLVQTEREQKGLVNIGVDSKRIEIVGNLKAEISLPAMDSEALDRMKCHLNITPRKRLVIAGSTHKGEEEKVLRAFTAARKENPDLLLIVAPRHPNRTDEVFKICRSTALVTVKRSQAAERPGWDIMILDTMGELAHFYALSDLAFVGGSLIPWGGQNLLEPAFYGKPVCFGPYMDNFSELADYFISADGARIVHDENELEILMRFQDPEALLAMGRRARGILDSLAGATEKTLQAMEDVMDRK